jgi:glycosyltransferase involved in cell wall biosynthesis
MGRLPDVGGRGGVVASIVIAAHNEEPVIGACLSALLGQGTDDVEIIVSANACTDRTADIARKAGALVVERQVPGKAAALNAAERVATRFPRIYLDADIVIPAGGIAALEDRLSSQTGVLAVVPARRVNTEGRPWPVRAYFQINTRLPAFRNGLFGRGCIAISESGRARFDTFPELISDDLFLDSQFEDAEKSEVSDVTVVVEAPWTTRDLLRRLVRVRRGNAQMRAAAADGDLDLEIRASRPWAWLSEVVVKQPSLAPAGLAYAILTLAAALRASRPAASGREWGRDDSTRKRAAAAAEGA